MTREQLIRVILKQEYEDGCNHPKLILEFPGYISPDVEGAEILVRCDSCGEVLEAGMVTE